MVPLVLPSLSMIRACFLISGAAASCRVYRYETVSELTVCPGTVSQKIHRRDTSQFHTPDEDCRLELDVSIPAEYTTDDIQYMHRTITHCYRSGFVEGIEKGLESVRAVGVRTSTDSDRKAWTTVECASRPRTDSNVPESLRNWIPSSAKRMVMIPDDEELVSFGSYSVPINDANSLELASHNVQRDVCKNLLRQHDKMFEYLEQAHSAGKTHELSVRRDWYERQQTGSSDSTRGGSPEFKFRHENPLREKVIKHKP